MGKLDTLFRILRTIARRPSSLLRVLADEREHEVRGRLGLPRGLPTVDLLDLFPGFTATVAPYSFLEGTSTVIDIALLNALAARFPGGRYLEIGTWRGESVANVARHAAECVSLSLSAEEMRGMGWPDTFVRTHRFFSEGLPNVRHIGHNSHTFDFASLEGKFDLIFIDGDHTYEGVRNDTRKAFPLLRDENSVIVWHDAGTSPENMRWDTLAGMLDGCPPEARGHLYRVSNTLCAIFLRNAPAASFPEVPRVPDKDFEIVIRARRR
jgi:predicted O-methyltransferase YrrM